MDRQTNIMPIVGRRFVLTNASRALNMQGTMTEYNRLELARLF